MKHICLSLIMTIIFATVAHAAWHVRGWNVIGGKTQDAAKPSLPQYDTSPITDVSREAIAERLRELAESESPKDLRGFGISGHLRPDEKKSCPECDKTMIVGEKDRILNIYDEPLKRIQDRGVDATLTVPEHCPTCGFGLKEKKFLLEIKYPDDPDFVRVELDEARDLQLMVYFLQGQDRYDEDQYEVPLKDKVDRLRKLFGVKE